MPCIHALNRMVLRHYLIKSATAAAHKEKYDTKWRYDSMTYDKFLQIREGN